MCCFDKKPVKKLEPIFLVTVIQIGHLPEESTSSDFLIQTEEAFPETRPSGVTQTLAKEHQVHKNCWHFLLDACPYWAGPCTPLDTERQMRTDVRVDIERGKSLVEAPCELRPS